MSDDDPLPRSGPVLHAALAGFSAVLVGNGLGRFAYTPLLLTDSGKGGAAATPVAGRGPSHP